MSVTDVTEEKVAEDSGETAARKWAGSRPLDDGTTAKTSNSRRCTGVGMFAIDAEDVFDPA